MILNLSFHYKIFEFDNDIIQILVWISIGSTCIQKRRNLAGHKLSTGNFFTLTRDAHGTSSRGAGL